MRKKLQIELKSDLCAGSGESLGSLIDTDICYDEYGFPYIPSKRLKGLIKEAFIEYMDWKKDESLIKIKEELFGTEDSRNSGNLRIDNAYLKNISSIENDIENIEEQYKKYLSKQRIVELNTDIRYQTAVDEESGVAKENSLRSIRVLESGNVFEAFIECDKEAEEKILEKCIKLLTHMGNNRTRGLGEIKCSIIDDKNDNKAKYNENIETLNEEKEYKIELLLKAESNIMVSKQLSEITENYIPGSNIMGSIANKYIKDKKIDNFDNIDEKFINLFLNGKVIYSNAYITEKDGKLEYYPAPLSYSKVKNRNKVYHNKMIDVNEENIQLSNFGDKFVTLTGENYIKEVLTSENYHHQRAKDLSIGHVSEGKDGGTFYQFLSIDQGQYFKTKIIGKGKELNEILKYIKIDEILRVGKSKTAEYGKLRVVNNLKTEIKETEKKYSKFAVILTSPLILFDESKVQIAKDKNTLINKLKETFGMENLKVTKAFIGYSEESGFNAIWKMPKEQVVSYASGTTIVFESESPVKLKEKYILGERINEGYGQLVIYDLADKKDSSLTFKEYKIKSEEKKYSEIQKETRKILNKSLKKVINEEILIDALNTVERNYNKISINNTTIGRILLMLKESKNYEEFDKNVNSIKDDKKLKNIIKIIENKENLFKLDSYKIYEQSLKSINGVIQNEEQEKFILEYIKQFFMILKIKGGKK